MAIFAYCPDCGKPVDAMWIEDGEAPYKGYKRVGGGIQRGPCYSCNKQRNKHRAFCFEIDVEVDDLLNQVYGNDVVI